MREGWEIKRVKEICDKASSNIAQKEIVGKTGDYPVYGASGYVQNVDFFHRDKPYIGIVKDGSGVGRVNTYPAKTSLLGTLQYIIPKDGYLLGYVAYLLKSLNLAKFATGAAIPHIYFKEYGECKVPVPPIAEQEKIVAELDCLTGIIEKKRQQLEELDKLAQSIFYDMFGDPITNEKGWETKEIGQFCLLKSGKGIKATELTSLPEEGRYACYGGNGIRGYIAKYSHKGCYPIIGRQGALCGNVVLAEGTFYATEHAVVVSPLQDNVNPLWLYFTLKLLNLNRFAQGVAQPGLAVGALNKVEMIVAPLDLQNAFAQKIEAIEKQKELIKKSIQETETLFNSRMDYWFN